MKLTNGSTVAVVGGGPAGAFTAYFLKLFSYLVEMEIQVDIYEPKDFSQRGAKGCNHCGGVVSESLVQFMATEGITIPPEIITNTIDVYTLHTDSGHVALHTPFEEMRIAAIFRGGGPKQSKSVVATAPIKGLDEYLLELACRHGANLIRERVTNLDWDLGRPQVIVKNDRRTYDLLVGATGINGTGIKLFESMGWGYSPPKMSKTFIQDLYLGKEVVEKYVGNSMHVFLLNIPGINQGAIIPKGDYATFCFVAQTITNELIEQFFSHPEVKGCLPPDWKRPANIDSCLCYPDTNVGDAINPYTDRVVMVGDCGVARLFKDGIGSAYRMAKACATTAVLWGISTKDFRDHYEPVCKKISFDNRVGHLVLDAFGLARTIGFVRYGILATAAAEQRDNREKKPMSSALWSAFSGSHSYVDIFLDVLGSPLMLMRLFWNLLKGLFNAKFSCKNS
ncbi:conserved hypothetical protein [Gammaproteobacteria bacterium]